jgi:hypothetical protein
MFYKLLLCIQQVKSQSNKLIDTTETNLYHIHAIHHQMLKLVKCLWYKHTTFFSTHPIYTTYISSGPAGPTPSMFTSNLLFFSSHWEWIHSRYIILETSAFRICSNNTLKRQYTFFPSKINTATFWKQQTFFSVTNMLCMKLW